MSNEHKAMLVSWVKVFVTSLLASFLALRTPPWELHGEQWLAILWSGLLAVALVVYNFLDPKDTRYGHGFTATPAPAPEMKAAPLAAVPKPKAPAAKKAPATPRKATATKPPAAKKAGAPKKAPAKKPAK